MLASEKVEKRKKNPESMCMGNFCMFFTADAEILFFLVKNREKWKCTHRKKEVKKSLRAVSTPNEKKEQQETCVQPYCKIRGKMLHAHTHTQIHKCTHRQTIRINIVARDETLGNLHQLVVSCDNTISTPTLSVHIMM